MYTTPRTRCLARAAGSFLIVATLVLLPSPARSEARWGFAGFGGYSSYAMDDVNAFVDSLNTALRDEGSPLQMDPIDGGPSYGLGVRLSTSDNVRFSLDYERLTGSSSLADFSGSITLNAPADALTASVSYFLPSESKARFGFGAGLGYYTSAGSLELEVAGGGSATLDWEGSGVGFHLLGQSDITLSRTLKLELGAGYRSAKVDWEMEGADMGGDVDWSGFASRIGLAFYP